jgi:hypothetical protein
MHIAHNPGNYFRYDIGPLTEVPDYRLRTRLGTITLRSQDGAHRTKKADLDKHLQQALKRCRQARVRLSCPDSAQNQGQNPLQQSQSTTDDAWQMALDEPDRDSIACIEPLTRGFFLDTLQVAFDFQPTRYEALFRFLKTSVYGLGTGDGSPDPAFTVQPGGDLHTGRFVRLSVTYRVPFLRRNGFCALGDLPRLHPALFLEPMEFRWFDIDAFRRDQARVKKPVAVAVAVNEIVRRILTVSLNAAEDFIRKETAETYIHPHPFTRQFKARAATCRFL